MDQGSDADLVRDRYEPVAVLGRGGQGDVLKALDHQHGRWVALKIRPAPDPEQRQALLTEARILLTLRPHPNLPLVREDFFWQDRYVLVMDWVDGVDLAQLVTDTGDPGLPVTSVVAYMAQVADALGHLHAQGVVHGDVKPANLVLTPDGRVVLVDFGVSQRPGDGTLTSLGSPGYAAPELGAGQHLTSAADVYSLAATAVALLTGAPPTEGRPDWEGVPNSGAIERALRRGLATDPARRPRSTGELVERLRAHLSLDLPTGVVTFLLTDIEGSTLLWEDDADVMADLLARHDAIIADAVESNGGRLLKTRGEGDATFSVFARASDAVVAAVAAQRELVRRIGLAVRMALHAGEAQVRDGDYYGRTVNRAARLRAVAHGGQILLSSAAADLVVDGLGEDMSLADLGDQALRDLARPEHVYALEHPDLGEDRTLRPAPSRASPPPATRLDVDGPTAPTTRPAIDAPTLPPAPPAARRELLEMAEVEGRDAELAALYDAITDAGRGRARVVLLAGEVGVGKSRLATEAAAMARGSGAQVLEGRAQGGDTAPAYWPWTQALRAYGPADTRDVLPTLADVIPALAGTPPDADELEPEVARAQLFDAVARHLAALADARPVVVILDDVHQADTGSVLLFQHLARALRTSRVLLVVAYEDTGVARGHPLAAAVADLLDDDHVTRLVLGGLPAAAVARLLERAGIDDADELAEEVHRRTDGNPFFVTEVARAFAAEGRLDVPPTVVDVVSRQLDRFGEDALRFLRVAAVAGAEVDLGLAGQVAGLDREAAVDAADVAVAAGVLVGVPGGPGRHRFAHEVVREAVYASMSAARRAHLHGQIGAAIEAELGGETAAHVRELAFHFGRAAGVGEAGRAVAYARQAAVAALDALAYEDAAVQFAAALDALASDPSPEPGLRVELLVAMGRAWARAGDREHASRAFTEAAVVARARSDSDGLARAALGLAQPTPPLPGVVDETVLAAIEEARAQPGVSPALLARLDARLAMELSAVDAADAEARADAALTAAEAAGDDGALATALHARQFVRVGDPSRAEEVVADGRRLVGPARAAGMGQTLALGQAASFVALLQLGRREEAEAVFGDTDAFGPVALSQFGRESPSSWAVLLAVMDGRLEAALSEIDKLLRSPDLTLRAAAGLQRFLVLFEQGRATEMEEALRGQVARDPTSVTGRILLISLLVDQGRLDEARAELELVPADARGAMPAPHLRGANLALLAEATAALRERHRAAALYQLLLPCAGRLLVTGSVACLGAVDRYLGVLARALGWIDEAARHLTAAAALDRQVGHRTAAAWDAYEHALLLLDRGDTTGAARLAARAVEAAEAHGLHRLATRARPLATTATHPGLPAGLTAGRTNPFVGRRAELSRLAAAWNDARNGDRRLVLLAGEPGIGKTRLAAEAAAAAHSSGALVLHGRCDEGLGVPYQPFVTALAGMLAAAPPSTPLTLGRLAGDLVRLVPEIAERVPDLLPPLRADPETEQYRLFDAVAGWLQATAAEAPLVLVLDDLHWATRPTLQLLRHVMRVPEPARLLVVGTYRDSELDRGHAIGELLADLHRVPALERVTLAGLSEDDVADFLEAGAGHPLGDDGVFLARTLHTETNGNPFFVREVVRHLVETGVVVPGADGWTVARPVDAVGVPDGVREVVGQRITRLSPPANRVLETAAVIGSEFELDVVREACGLDEETVLGALDEAVAARLVFETDPLRYRFAHALVRSTLYDELARARRIRTHQRIGEALEHRHGDRIDEHLPGIAHHFAEAAAGGEGTKAVEYATRAGDLALARLAHDEAVTFYGLATDLLVTTAEPVDEQRRCRLMISLGEAERRAGRPGYRETLLEAAHLGMRWRDAELVAAAALANNRSTFSAVGEVDVERVAVLEAALDLVGPEDSKVRARLVAHLAVELAFSGEWDRRVALSDEAVAMARRLGDPATLAAVLVLRSPTIWHASTLAERVALAAEQTALAAELSDPTLALHAAVNGIHAALEIGDADAAEARLERAIALALELGQPTLRWLVTFQRARWCAIHGDFEEAERFASEALELGRAAGQPDAFAAYAAQLFTIRTFQGRLDEIVDLVAMAAEANPDLPGFQTALAQCLVEIGRPGDARAPYERLAESGFVDLPRDVTWIIGVTMGAFVCARLGDAPRADVLLALLEPYRDQFASDRPTWGGSVHYFCGLLERTLERWDEADESFTKAGEAHARLGARPLLALTRLDHAEMLVGRARMGDVRRARELLASALAIAEELGMKSVAGRARRLAADALAPTLPPALASARAGPFVGRVAELDRLAAAAGTAIHGAPRIALIGGEPGVGKTRLVAEAASAALRRGCTVLYGRCDEGLGVPFQPFVEALAQAVAATPDAELRSVLGPLAAELSRLVPDIGERLPELAAPARSDPETERYRLFDAVAGWLTATSERTPVVLVLDDLHGAARPTLQLLRHVSRVPAPARLLVVGAYRDTELGRVHPLTELLADLHRVPGVDRLALAGLAEDEIAALVASSPGAALDAAAAAATLQAETQGNPFFVREVIRQMAESGGRLEHVPEGIRDLVGRRLSRLAPATVAVLEVAAVIGADLDARVLERAATLGEDAVLGALDEAVAAGLLEEQGGLLPRYRFAHAIVRSTIYDDLAGGALAQAHLRVAEAVEAVYAADLEDHLSELARHFTLAGPGPAVARAVAYATRAGDRALAALAHDEAVSYYRRALSLLADWTGLSDEADRRQAELLVRLGDAQRRAGDADHRTTLLDAAALARRVGDVDLLARAALANYRQSFSNVGNVDPERTAVLESAIAAVGGADTETRARLLAHLAVELMFSGDFERRDSLSAEAVEIARRLGDPATLAYVLACRSEAIGHPTRDAERRLIDAEQADLAEQVGDPQLLYHSTMNRYFAALSRRDIVEADLRLAEATDLAEGLSQPSLRWSVLAAQAMRSFIAGRLDEAEGRVMEAFELGQEAGQADAFIVFVGQIGLLRFFQGRLSELEPVLAAATGIVATVPTLLAAVATMYAELGRTEEAAAFFEQLAADDFSAVPFDVVWLTGLALAAQTCHRLGDRTRARALVEHLEPYSERFVAEGPNFLGSVARYLGLLCMTLQRWDEAEHHFEAAVDAHAAIGAEGFLTLTRLDLGRMLVARGWSGDRARARSLLAEVAVAAEALGMTAARSEALAIVGDLDRPPLPPPLATARRAFVGRDDELGQLRQVWHKVAGGARQLALVAGEPGIGKTSLVVEVAIGAHEDGAAVLFGRCDEDAVVPFQPFVEVLRDLSRSGVLDPATLAPEVARLLPDVPDGGDDGPPGDPDTERGRLFDAVATLFERLGRERPVVLVLDDLHWADRATLLLVRHLVRHASGTPLLVLGTYRDTEVARTHPLAGVLADLRRERLFERTVLRGMSTDDVQAMLEARIGSATDNPVEFAAGLRRAADGNPFFIDELLRHLAESGSLVQHDGRWEVDGGSWDELGIPEGVREVIGRRLSRLSDGCNLVLAAAAVVGRAVPFDLARRMVELSDDAVVAAVEEAVASGLLLEDDAAGALCYVFSHALVRETLYEELSLPRRQRLHLRAAQAIEAAHEPDRLGDHAGALAAHYRLAGAAADQARAVEWSIRAGDAAARMFAYEEAAAHWDAAVTVLRDLSGEEHDLTRARILERLSSLAYLTGTNLDAGVAYNEEALAVYETYGLAARAARVHSRLGAHFANSAPGFGLDVERAMRHFRAAEPALAGEESVAAGYFNVSLAHALLRLLRLDDVERAAGRGIAVADAVGHEVLGANARLLLGLGRWEAGGLDEAGALVEDAWRVADETDNPLVALLATWNRGDQLLSVDRPADAELWYSKELHNARLARAPGALSSLRSNLARALFGRGRLADARRELAASGAPVRLLLDDDWETPIANQRAELDRRRATSDLWGLLWLSPQLAEQARIAGDLGLALRVLDDAVALAADRGARVLEVLSRLERALVLLARDRRDEASLDIQAVAALVGRGTGWGAVPTRMALIRALLLGVGGDLAESRGRFASVRAEFEHAELPWLEAETGVLAGRAYLAAGDRDPADAEFAAALAVYRRIEAPGRFFARVDALKGEV